MKYFMILVQCLIFPGLSFASSQVGLGSVALNLMYPVIFLSDFVHSASLIIGGLFLFASLIKYRQHRRNPTMMPLSTVIFLLIAGVLLVCLPLISLVTKNSVPYKLIR